MSLTNNFGFEAGERPFRAKVIIPELKRTRKTVEALQGLKEGIDYIGDATNPKIKRVQNDLNKLIREEEERYDRNEEELNNVTGEFNNFKTKTEENITILKEIINGLQRELAESKTIVERIQSILEGRRQRETEGITVTSNLMTTLQQKCEKADQSFNLEIEDQADERESKNMIEKGQDVYKNVMEENFLQTEEQSNAQHLTINSLSFKNVNRECKNILKINRNDDLIELFEREHGHENNNFMRDDEHELNEIFLSEDDITEAEGNTDDFILMVFEGDSTKPLPFTGDGSVAISEFLTEYEDFVMTSRVLWNDQRKALGIRAFLADRAREVYNQIPNKDNYEEVKAFLIQKFQTKLMMEKAQNRLTIMKQGPNESVLEFSNRLTKVVKQVMAGKKDTEYQERLLEEFCNKMSLDYRHLVRGQNPDTYEKALDLAEQYEADLAYKNTIRPKDNTFAVERQDEDFWEGQGQLSISKNINQVLICDYCGNPGHQPSACWSNPQAQPTPSLYGQAFGFNQRGNNHQSYGSSDGQMPNDMMQQWQNSWQAPLYQPKTRQHSMPQQMPYLNNDQQYNNMHENGFSYDDEVNMLIEGKDNKKEIVLADTVYTLLNDMKQKVIAVTAVEVNEVWMTGLIDTGSSITVCSLPLVKMLKAEMRKVDRKISGLFGNPGSVCGSIIGNIKIGGSKYRTEIFVLNIAKLTQSGYCDIIVGCDTLERGSEIGVDCAQRMMQFGGQQIKMGIFDRTLRQMYGYNSVKTVKYAEPEIAMIESTDRDTIFVIEGKEERHEGGSYRKIVDDRCRLKQMRKLKEEIAQYMAQMTAAGIIRAADSLAATTIINVQKDNGSSKIINDSYARIQASQQAHNNNNIPNNDKTHSGSKPREVLDIAEEIEIAMPKEENFPNTVNAIETVRSQDMNVNSRTRTQPMVCTYCGKTGHLVEKYWRARRKQLQKHHQAMTSTHCTFGGLTGHTGDRCWKARQMQNNPNAQGKTVQNRWVNHFNGREQRNEAYIHRQEVVQIPVTFLQERERDKQLIRQQQLEIYNLRNQLYELHKNK